MKITPLLRCAALVVGAALLCTSAAAQTRFASVALHDIVDRAADVSDDTVTTDELVAFLDWLRGNGWTAVSLDDLERARRGEKPLPDKAILLTVDDGYRSLYERIYPLVLAYRMPIVAALVGEWFEAPAGATVRYGGQQLPRERFVTAQQAREMQASGLVEFALHTHALHAELTGNPQGNTMPAATTRAWSAAGYEDEAALRARLRSDFARGRALLERELGRAPRALVWPYGRYDAIAQQEARALAFTHALTLDDGPGDPRMPMAVPRVLLDHGRLADWTGALRFDAQAWRTHRIACLDPATLWSADPAEQDARLGRAIERARHLGLTGVLVDALSRDAQGGVRTWFPSREIESSGDWLSRVAWQMQSRAGIEVYARLPHRAALAALGGDPRRMRRLYEDLGAAVPLSGWLLEGEPVPADTQPGAPADWAVLARRRAWLQGVGPDDLPSQAFAALDAARPGLRLLWLAPAGSQAVHPLADLSLMPLALDAARTAAQPGPVDARAARWFELRSGASSDALATAARAFVRAGGVSFGWCPDDALADMPEAARIAPGVSAATFPARP